MVITVEADNDELIFTERSGGDGGTYYYVEREGELIPISSLSSKSDRTSRRIKQHIPKSKIQQNEVVYSLDRTNSGAFIPTKHQVSWSNDSIETDDLASPSEIALTDDDFAIIGSEKDSLREYRENVPEMADEINSIRESFGFEFHYGGKKRTKESIEDDSREAVVSSLMFTSSGSRTRSLNERIKLVHEIFGTAVSIDEIANAVTGRTENTVWLETPSAVLETDFGQVTVCYQFSLIEESDVTFSSSERQFVRPDLALVPGNWMNSLQQLRESVPKGTVLIDMKHQQLSDEDVAQLTGYTKAVPESTRIVASIEAIPQNHESTLDNIGWKSARLAPGKTERFRSSIVDALRSASWTETVDIDIDAPDVPNLSELASLSARGKTDEVQQRLDADESDLQRAIGKSSIESYNDCLKAILHLGGED